MGVMELIERFVAAHERLAQANEELVKIYNCAPVEEPVVEEPKKPRRPRKAKEQAPADPTPPAPEPAVTTTTPPADEATGSAPDEAAPVVEYTLADLQKAVKDYAANRIAYYGGVSAEDSGVKATADARALMKKFSNGTAEATKSVAPFYYAAIIDACRNGWTPEEEL